MSYFDLVPADLGSSKYIITHVFCPLQLPDGDDHSTRHDRALTRAVASVARLYCDYVGQRNLSKWLKISRMLDNLLAVVQFESLDRTQITSQLSGMGSGDVLAFLIRAQNAAVVFRKAEDVTVLESFEVSPKAQDVMSAQGKLGCSYPGPAIEVPNLLFDEKGFLSELVNFLVHMNDDVLDAIATTRKAQHIATEARDTTHPRYITELLTGILRSVGQPGDIDRITKRVGDDVVWNNSSLPWRRSPLWLLIRVVLQTSLVRSELGNDTYKRFMLFFMCCLAKEKAVADLPNDLLQFMLAKIGRRLWKLGSSAPAWLSRAVLQTCTSLRSVLEMRETDIQLSFHNSGHYLRNSLANQGVNQSKPPFTPKHIPRGSLDDFLSGDGGFFERAYRTEPHVALYDVECAVEEGIDNWIEKVSNCDKACVKLEVLANKYSSNALDTYEDNPELLSVMLLTTFELWVALDKLAIRSIPMLANYSPEIPTYILEDMLLSKTSSFYRLRRIHDYLSHRHSKSHKDWSVFSPTITADSFAVRFYETSTRLHSLKTQIEEDAQLSVQEKVDDLEKANAYHAELQLKAARAEHEFDINQRGHQYHVGHCNKCALERECKEMKITIHEWPLPAEQFQAEAVVFELNCPVSFNMWRSATFHLLVDICSLPADPEFSYMELGEYPALQSYLVQHPRSRITLASDTKPFIASHYSKTSIPSTKERVCIKNGLKFYGYDTRARIPSSKVLDGVNTNGQSYFTYTLPRGPYENLQEYLHVTTHSSNDIVASQIDCHNDLSIHEYMAFGHLRSGSMLQWFNILRELRGRSLTFRRHEVHLLFAQATSQVGPLEDKQWTWHQELREPSFCYALLNELERLLRDIEANWLEMVTMDTISFLLRRLLASEPNQDVSFRALELLRTVRRKVLRWVQELSAKLTKMPGDEEFRGFLRDAAAICRSTFNVDPAMIPKLIRSPEDVEIILSSAVLIHDHTPSKISSLTPYSKLLLDRDRRLSLVLERILRNVIQDDPNDRGINLAIRKVWPDYRPRSKWTQTHNAKTSCWFSCMTAPTGDQCSQTVHFNLLNGSLLVNGKPLGRLPNEIMRHSLYNLVFGEEVLEVIPSDLAGMDYSTRATISSHQVYFSLRNNELVIRAKRAKPPVRRNRRQRAKRAKTSVFSESELIELVPPEVLEGDLPAVLIEGHVHWLNLSTSVLEIRPLKSIWDSLSENWNIRCVPGHYQMQKGNEFLVDVRSQSWNEVSALMSPLEIPENLIISVSPVDHSESSSLRLSVVLPRYGLSFCFDEDGDLQSRNMRGMVYDEDQSIGTLFGLVNRLVLRPKTRGVYPVELVPRCVLIPDGKVSFQSHGHHVRVEIDTHGPALQRITYQAYRVDTDLGCLTGNVSLSNKLYCAYLHALTSGCGADPLTSRSGTEEALSLLRSAGCWSIVKFTSHDANLLALIASMCPSRTWYPTHLKSMQKVQWCNLPVLSQHHDLYIVAKAIKEHYEKIQLFHITVMSQSWYSKVTECPFAHKITRSLMDCNGL